MKKTNINLVRIGRKIRNMRELKGFSQDSFASQAKFGRTYYGRVERGEQNITVQNLIRIAFALEVEVHHLMPRLRMMKKPEPRILH